MLHKIILYFSIRISLLIFHKRQPLSYSIFNFLFEKNIKKKNSLPNIIKEFNENGYCKLPINLSGEIEEIKNHFNEKNKVNIARIDFDADINSKKKLIDLLEKKLSNFFDHLEQYYKNNRPIICNLSMWTNYNYKTDNHSKDLFSESYHNDGYLSNYIKIHINCHDIKLNDGPMFFIKKKYNKEFIKVTNYKDRFSYKNIDDILEKKDMIYKNVGQKGDAVLFDPTICFHKATIPNQDRTIVQLILFIPPKKILTDTKNYEFTKIKRDYMKPYSMIKMIKLYSMYSK